MTITPNSNVRLLAYLIGKAEESFKIKHPDKKPFYQIRCVPWDEEKHKSRHLIHDSSVLELRHLSKRVFDEIPKGYSELEENEEKAAKKIELSITRNQVTSRIIPKTKAGNKMLDHANGNVFKLPPSQLNPIDRILFKEWLSIDSIGECESCIEILASDEPTGAELGLKDIIRLKDDSISKLLETTQVLKAELVKFKEEWLCGKEKIAKESNNDIELLKQEISRLQNELTRSMENVALKNTDVEINSFEFDDCPLLVKALSQIKNKKKSILIFANKFLELEVLNQKNYNELNMAPKTVEDVLKKFFLLQKSLIALRDTVFTINRSAKYVNQEEYEKLIKEDGFVNSLNWFIVRMVHIISQQK